MAKTSPKTTHKDGKTRHNVVFTPSVKERGEKLAEEDKRSFSNMMEILIDREWERRFGKKAA